MCTCGSTFSVDSIGTPNPDTPPLISKSFLLLFFKKEVLASLLSKPPAAA
jgi:hypothetical protein